jgi:hypothetical protein
MPLMGVLTTGDLAQAVTAYAVRNMRYIDSNIVQDNPLEKFWPFEKSDEQQIEFWAGAGTAGVMGVDRDAAVPFSRTTINRYQYDLLTDKYGYFLKNDMLERAAIDPAAKYAYDGNMFFGRARAYKQVAALLAGAGQTVSSTNTWDKTSPESSITEGLDKLTEYGWNGNMGAAICIFPARVGRGLYQQRFAQGAYTSILSVLKKGYAEIGMPIEFVPYAPFYGSMKSRKIDILTGTDSDALGNDAILAVGSPRVLESVYYQYTKTPGQFVSQVGDEGFATMLHRVQDARVVPLFDETSTSVLVVKITGAAPARE